MAHTIKQFSEVGLHCMTLWCIDTLSVKQPNQCTYCMVHHISLDSMMAWTHNTQCKNSLTPGGAFIRRVRKGNHSIGFLLGVTRWHVTYVHKLSTSITLQDPVDKEPPTNISWIFILITNKHSDITIDHTIPYTLQVGAFCIEPPSIEPKKEEVKLVMYQFILLHVCSQVYRVLVILTRGV